MKKDLYDTLKMFLPISIENKWSEEIEDGDISNHDSYVDEKKKIDDNQKKIQDEYYRHPYSEVFANSSEQGVFSKT